MANNKILSTHGERLGVRDPATIQKADALFRLLNSKPSSRNISDVAKIVLCLDLAATILNVSFDKETALRLTGLRKTVYHNHLNNVEKILNLDRPTTVAELCVQFSCPEAADTAVRILQSYKERDTKIKDIAHPQYVAAAVFTSCKLHGVKIDKSQLKLVSRLKLAQWNELTDEFSKFAASLGLSGTKKRNAKKSTTVEVGPVEEVHVNPKTKDKTGAIETYEAWRERILREASMEILRKEMEEST